MRLTVTIESLVLAGVCIADMIATIIFVALGRAVESNPLMAICLGHSVATFVAVKIASFVPFIIICEHYRKRNPQFVRFAMRTAIILYLAVYVALVTRQNFSS